MSICLAALLAQEAFIKLWEIEGFKHEEMIAFDDTVVLFRTRTDTGDPAVRCFGMNDGKERWTYTWDPKWTDGQFTIPDFAGGLGELLNVRLHGDRVAIVGARLVTLLETDSGKIVMELKLASKEAGHTLGELSADGLHVTTYGEARRYGRDGKLAWNVKPGTRKVERGIGLKSVTCDEVFVGLQVHAGLTFLITWPIDKVPAPGLRQESRTQVADSKTGASLDLFPRTKGVAWDQIEGDYRFGAEEGAVLVYSLSKRKQVVRQPVPKSKFDRVVNGRSVLRYSSSRLPIGGRTVHESEGKHYALYTWTGGSEEPSLTRIVDLDSGKTTFEEDLGRWKPEWLGDAGLLLSNSHEGIRLIHVKEGRQIWKHVPKQLVPDSARVVPVPFGDRAYYFLGFSNRPGVLVELDMKKGTVLREIVAPDTIQMTNQPPRPVAGTRFLMIHGIRPSTLVNYGEGPVLLDTTSGELGMVHVGVQLSSLWTSDGRRNLGFTQAGTKDRVVCTELKPGP